MGAVFAIGTEDELILLSIVDQTKTQLDKSKRF